jgi:cold shock CspA family protein
MASPKNTTPEITASIDVRLLDLETKIDQARSLYEQYFAGVLKQEPKKEFESVNRLVNSFKPQDLKTTASRFRFQNIQQRYIVLRNHWDKILKQIEEGTFKRDLFLLKHKNKGKSDSSKSILKENTKPTTHQLDKLYEKLVELSQGQEKIPDKDRFIGKIDLQIQKLKEKNPGKKVEVKLQRNKLGKIAVNIALK